MEGLGAGLARRGGDVSEYECNERLAVAVRASSAQYDDLDTLARLRVRLDRAAASETGLRGSEPLLPLSCLTEQRWAKAGWTWHWQLSLLNTKSYNSLLGGHNLNLDKMLI